MKPVAKNFFSLLAADIVRRLLGFASVAYLARVLGTEWFGAVSIAFAVLSYGIIVNSLGLTTLGAREIADGGSNDIVSDILSLRLVMAIGVVGVTAILAFLFVRDPTTATLIVIFSISIFAYAMLLEWYFQGKENMGIMGIGRVSSPALYLLLLVLFVKSPNEVLWVGVAAVAGDFLFAFVLLRKFRKDGGRFQFRVRLDTWKSMIKQSLPVGTGLLLAQFTVNYPPVALALLKSNTDVGIFSAASKLVFYLLMVDRVLAPLLLPALTRWQGISIEILSRRAGDVLRLLMIAGMPIAVGGTLLAAPLVAFVFGVEYAAAADVFRVFVWYFFLTIMSSVYGTALWALGQNKAYGSAMLAGACILLVGVTLLTALYGYMGTAFGIVISEGITLAILQRQLKKHGAVSMPHSVWKIFAASGFMAVAVWLMAQFHFLVVIVLGAAIYGILVLVFRVVTKEEIYELLRKA